MSTNPALPARSMFATTVMEGYAPRAAHLEGTIPDWLRGDLVRTAPALFAHGGWAAAHWFDAVGMLYRFSVKSPTEVTWAQRLLECDAARHALAGRVPVSSFGTPNGRPWWKRVVQPIPQVSDNTNVNVLKLGPDWVAMTETATQYMVDPETLSTRGAVRYDDALGDELAMLAHPHFDFARGKAVNVGSKLGMQAELLVFEHDPAERRRVEVGRWKGKEMPYVHSFALTATKAVLIDHPLRVRPASMLWSNKGYIDHFRWDGAGPTRLIVIDRAGGPNRVLETDGMFVFHTVNAFDDGDGLVMDVLAYPDASIVDALRVERLTTERLDLRASLVRLRLDLASKTVRREVLLDDGFEFPSVSYRKVSGGRHGAVWGARLGDAGEGMRSTLVRVDPERGEVARYSDGDVVYGEPVFVARPGATDEDDGVLLAVGSSPSAGRSHLAVLRASDLERIATASVETPLPLGFHGSFARAV